MSKRRDNGAGHIKQRKDGMWRAMLRYTDPITELSHRAQLYGKTRADVFDKLNALKARVAVGEPAREAKVTVADLMRRWLDDVSKPAVSPDTFALYEMVNRLHLTPTLGAQKIATLRTAAIEHVLCGSEAKGALRMRQLALMILDNALETAVRWRLIARNPAEGIKKPTKGGQVEDDDVRPLTPAQVGTLLDAARKHGRFELYAFAIFAGARQGEILALRWVDIDLQHGRARVRGTLNRRTRKVKAPKTKRSRRTIGLTPALCEMLSDYLARTKGELLFPANNGKPLSGRNVTREFKETLIEAKLAKPFYENGRRIRGKTDGESFRFHDLRHTYATLSLLAGVPLKVVSEQLGHSSIQITADTYMHLLPAMQAEASHALDRYFTLETNGVKNGVKALAAGSTRNIEAP